MADLKLTVPIVAMLRERRAAGLSNRELAAWLSATHGVEVSHEAVRLALQKPAPSSVAGSPARPEAEAGPKRGRRAPAPSEAAPDDGTDAADVELLSRVIGDLEHDVERAREAGATQALATLLRLHADLIKRRRDLRPPPPPADTDAELLSAGERAVEKLQALVDAEVEAFAPVVAAARAALEKLAVRSGGGAEVRGLVALVEAALPPAEP